MKLEAEILEEVKKNVQGIQFKTLAKKLKMFNEKEKAELKICLNNLASARLVTINHNKGIISIGNKNDFIYKGIITIDKHTGYGYVKSEGKIFIIRHDYLNGALNGDTVLIKSSNNYYEGKIIAFVDKIVERKELTLKAVFRNSKVVTLDSNEEIKINPKETNNVKENTIINVKLHNNSMADYISDIIDPTDKFYLEKSITLKYGFPIEFSKEAIKEVDSISDEISDEEISQRLDLRDLPIVTIDCDGTKDRDDAVYVEKLKNGNYKLIVSIAHVSKYVNPNNTPHLFKEACERGCSVYVDDYVNPQLPPKLSNGICSLNPDVDRLTLSTILEIDKNGNIIKGDIVKSIIRSKAAMKYSVVNKYLEDNESVPEYQNELGDQIKLLMELCDIQEKYLNKNGKKNFTSSEIEITSDDFNQPTEFNKRSTGKAQRLIENDMIYANMYLPEYFNDYPFIFRIHDIPNEEKLEIIIDELKNNNFSSIIKKDFDADNLDLLLNKITNIEDIEERTILSNQLLRCMSRAKYSTTNIGHYGLGLPQYCHSTSPIRRIPDLLLQILFDLKDNKKHNLSKSVKAKILSMLNYLCIKANSREIAENDVEKEALKIKMMNYMINHIGEHYIATITDIGSEKIFLTLDNNIYGFAALDDILFGSFKYNGNKNILIDEFKGIKLSIGDKLTVYYNGDEKDKILEFMVENKIKQKCRTHTLNN